MRSSDARTTRPAAALIASLMLLLAACSSSGSDEAGTNTEASTPSTAGGAGSIDGPDPTDSPGDPNTSVPDTSAPDASAPGTSAAPGTTTASPEADQEVCGVLERIADYDDQAEELSSRDAPWSELQQFFIDTTPKVLDIYDEAIDVGSRLTAELQTLRDFTETTAGIAAEASSLEEFGAGFTAAPGLEEAGAAGQKLNTFAEETCGISTGGGAG